MVLEDREKSWHPKKIRSSQWEKPTKNEASSGREVPPFRPSLNTGENILIRKLRAQKGLFIFLLLMCDSYSRGKRPFD